MERRTSFARCLRQGFLLGSGDRGGVPARRGRRETEEKKNESAHCNNCSGSIIPTQEQITRMHVSMEMELLHSALPWMIPSGPLCNKQQGVSTHFLQSKIKGFQQFTSHVIKEILTQCDWNVEAITATKIYQTIFCVLCFLSSLDLINISIGKITHKNIWKRRHI